MKRLLLIILTGCYTLAGAQNYNSLNGPYGGGVDKIIAAGSGRLLAVKSDAGVFRSDDAGATWTKSSTGLTGFNPVDLFMDASGKIYTLYDNSLFVSNDNGSNWTLLANTGFSGASRIAQGPSGNLFIASGSNVNKIYRSTNGGTAWFERIQFANSSVYNNVSDFEFTATGRMLIATSTSGLYITTAETDLSASNITTVQGLQNNALMSIVQNGTNIFVLTAVGPAKSTNGGTSFTPATASPLPSCCYYNEVMEKDPNGTLYLTQTSNVYKSADGSTWTLASAGPVAASPQYRSMLFSSTTTYYLSLFGVGIFKTTNTGTNWTAVNNGMYANDLGNIVITDNGRLLVSKTYGGLGFNMSTDDGVTWDYFASGTTARTITGFTKTGSTIFGYGQGIIKTTDNASSWTLVHNGTSTPNFPQLYNLMTNDGTTIFTMDNYDQSTGNSNFGLWKSINGGSTFARATVVGLPASSSAGFINTNSYITMDSNGNIFLILYTYATGVSTLYKIPNGSITATAVTNTGLSNFSDIDTKLGKVYVLGSGKFVVTSDGGANWTTKTTPSPFTSFEPINDNIVYGFNSSIYITTDGGNNWTNTGSTNPAGVVNDIAVSPSNFSYVTGRFIGVHKSKTSVVPPAAPTSLAILASSHNSVALEWTDNSTTESYFVVEASENDNAHYDSVASFVREEFYVRSQGVAYAYNLKPSTKYYFRVKAVGPGGYSTATNEVNVTLQADCTAQSDIPLNRSWTATTLNLSGTNIAPVNNRFVRANTAAPGDLRIEDISLGIANDLGTLTPAPAVIVNNCGSIFLTDALIGDWVPNGPATWNSTTKKITIPIKTHPAYALRSETVVYTLNATDPAPAAPTSLLGGVYTTGSVLIGWTGVSFVTKYEIERSTAVNTAYAKIAEVTYDFTSYKDLDPTLVPGTKYFYRVRAVNATGNSAYSNEINVTPSNAYNFDAPVNLPSKMFFTSATGGAWGDIDGDGFEDLLIGGLTDSLSAPTQAFAFKSDGKGKFTKMAIAELASEATGDYRSASILDINNDGYNDLFLTRSSNRDFMLLQNADGTWSKTFMPYLATSTIPNTAWVDLDNDGDLDLVWCSDGSASADVKIYKNNGSAVLTPFTDTEITSSVSGGTRYVSFVDYDNDGLMDALKLNRQTGPTQRSTLYRNTGDGKLKAVIGSVFDNIRPGHRTASWGDYDNDGDMDVFVGTQSSATPELMNRLFTNNGDGTFTEAAGAPMNEQVLTYGGAWADIDNDTDLDLLVSTSVSNRIFFNNGNGTFTRSTKDELFTNPNMGKLYGLSMADFDNDGFLDFYNGGFSGQNIPNFIYRNQTAPSTSRNWLKVKLTGTVSNRSAVGVRLKLVVGSKTLIRQVVPTSAFGTQSSLIQHFGLGAATSATSLTIYWPSGIVQTISPVSTVNTTLNVIEDNVGPSFSVLSPPNGSTVPAVTKLEITLNEESFGVSGKKISVALTSAPNAPVYELDAGLGVKSGNKHTFTLPAKLDALLSFQVSVEAGAFKDVYGNASAALAAASWKFQTDADPDAGPPVITFDPTSLNTLERGFAPKTVNMAVSDDKGVTGVTFFHRKIGASTFEQVSLGVSPNSISVNSTMTDDMGMEYYIRATDLAGNVARSPVGTGFHRSIIQFTGANRPVVQIPSGGTAEGWKIIAVPYDLPSNQVSVLFSEMGTASTSTWMLIHYQLSGGKQTWSQYPSFSTIERGKGYFVNAITGKNITLDDSKAPTFTREAPFKMDLEKGWNQIGNPYSVAINWNDVRTASNATATIKELYLYTNGAYVKNPELLPGTGGFVFATDAVSNLPITFPGQGPARISTPSFGTIHSDSWLADMKLTNGNMTSPVGGVGMHPMSSDSYDELDEFSPPRFIDYLEFNFRHPEYSYTRFGRDVARSSDNYMWEFEVETNLKGATTLSWQGTEGGSGERQLYLYDVTRQIPVDMTSERSYTFDPSQGNKFRVYYGNDVLAKIKPERALLGAAFPNPAESIATIPFSLPENNGKFIVRLDVFDMLGRKVATPFDGELGSGFYKADWQAGEANPNGVYIYKLSIGSAPGGPAAGEVLSGKILLKR